MVKTVYNIDPDFHSKDLESKNWCEFLPAYITDTTLKEYLIVVSVSFGENNTTFALCSSDIKNLVDKNNNYLIIIMEVCSCLCLIISSHLRFSPPSRGFIRNLFPQQGQ